MSSSAKIVPVATPEVAGVTVRRHELDREAARMCRMAKQFGLRLQRWLFETAAAEDQDGNELPAVLPPESVVETWKQYNVAISTLLKEQRERAKMAPDKGGLALTDAEFDAKLKEIAQAALNEMSDDDLAELIRARKVLK